jgi:Lecithin retinol acyltransferase
MALACSTTVVIKATRDSNGTPHGFAEAEPLPSMRRNRNPSPMEGWSPPGGAQRSVPVGSSGMSGRFRPGDHLHVRRLGLYFHHGIYVGDDRVIQFGSVSVVNKHGVTDAVSLQDFEGGGTARVVRHGYGSWFTGWHPPADESWKIIQRAEFLLKLQPRLQYNLIGHNCEIIANMCVSGGWTESYQARRYFTVRTVIDVPLSFWLASHSRAELPTPRWVSPVVVGGLLLSIGVKVTYDHQIRLFWNEIRDEWLAHERMLAKDPRNDQIG